MIDSYDNATPTAAEAVSLDTWRRLYDLAERTRALEPWTWMEETDVFGVEDPEAGQILFVSVMGLLGEYRAVAVYPGALALSQFWQMQDAPNSEILADIMFGIHHAHAAFGGKKDLLPQEKRLVDALGMKFKGPAGWPYFRSHKPGWVPWTIDAREARWIALALENLLDVAPRVQKDRRLLGTGGAERQYLVRSRSGGNIAGPWRDTRQPCPPSVATLQVRVPMATVRDLRGLQSNGITVEMDVFPSFMKIGKRGERAQTPFILMVCETERGLILGIELMNVEGAIEDLWARVPAQFVEILARNRIRPDRLRLRTAWIAMVLDALCRELGIEMALVPEIPAVAQARQGLDRFNRGPGG